MTIEVTRINQWVLFIHALPRKLVGQHLLEEIRGTELGQQSIGSPYVDGPQLTQTSQVANDAVSFVSCFIGCYILLTRTQKME
jgi:hypothetical protein